MDILSTLSFVLFFLYLTVDSIDARRGGGRFSFRSSRYSYYSGSSGSGSSLGGIIAGSIIGAIFLIALIIILVPVCKRKFSGFSLRKKIQRVHVTKTPNKNIQQKKKRDDDAFKLAADSDDDDSKNEISFVATGSLHKAKLTKNRRTFSTPISRMTFSEDTVKKEEEKINKKKSNRIRTVQAVSTVYGKAKTKKKKKRLEAMEAEKDTNGIPETPPPPYEELEYRPNIPPPSYSSCKSPYPPTAFDYGY